MSPMSLSVALAFPSPWQQLHSHHQLVATGGSYHGPQRPKLGKQKITFETSAEEADQKANDQVYHQFLANKLLNKLVSKIAFRTWIIMRHEMFVMFINNGCIYAG